MGSSSDSDDEDWGWADIGAPDKYRHTITYHRMNRNPKMDDHENRQQISESEPRSNDSSKKESSRYWTCCDLSWIREMLLTPFLFSGLCLLSFSSNLGSAWENLLNWVFQKQDSDSDSGE